MENSKPWDWKIGKIWVIGNIFPVRVDKYKLVWYYKALCKTHPFTCIRPGKTQAYIYINCSVHPSYQIHPKVVFSVLFSFISTISLIMSLFNS